MVNSHICPVCGEFEFEEKNSFDICEVCGWEDDRTQERSPDLQGGPNGYSLNEYREVYKNKQLRFQLDGKLRFDEWADNDEEGY